MTTLEAKLRELVDEICQVPVELHGIKWSSKTRCTTVKHNKEKIAQLIRERLLAELPTATTPAQQLEKLIGELYGLADRDMADVVMPLTTPTTAELEHSRPHVYEEEPCGTAENATISTTKDTRPTAKTVSPSGELLLEWPQLSKESREKVAKWFQLASERLQMILDEPRSLAQVREELPKAPEQTTPTAAPPTLNDQVESLSAELHSLYQAEAKRQGDVRHHDNYADLNENIKEFDRVLARFILQREMQNQQPPTPELEETAIIRCSKCHVLHHIGESCAFEQPTPEQTDPSAVPDLYRLAYIPGCWKCEKCGFVLTKQTMNFALGMIGTTPENRQSEQCPNDGEWMKPVTYREQLEVYSERLTEVFNERDKLVAELAQVREEMK
jgi:hypothetical protein